MGKWQGKTPIKGMLDWLDWLDPKIGHSLTKSFEKNSKSWESNSQRESNIGMLDCVRP